MKRFKVQSLNGNRLYNEKRIYSAGDVVIYNECIYQNYTGINTIPGTDDNWILIFKQIDLANPTGFAQYVDNQFTSASPLIIPSGTIVTLPCNGATKDESQLPDGFPTMFDTITNKLQAINVNDKFLTEVRFKAKTSVVNDFISVGIDIGATNLVTPRDVVFTRGANTEQEFSIPLTYFTRATFIANGGLIKVRSRNGNLQIYDIQLLPELTYKGR